MTSMSRRGPAFGWTSLTEAEQRLADLVALGLTNRELAERLYVSSHTIDAHLRHIYRKLGISSRVDLTRLVTQRQMSTALRDLPDGVATGSTR
jgi:DNA-binding CsgD family transcriptional regulator